MVSRKRLGGGTEARLDGIIQPISRISMPTPGEAAWGEQVSRKVPRRTSVAFPPRQPHVNIRLPMTSSQEPPLPLRTRQLLPRGDVTRNGTRRLNRAIFALLWRRTRVGPPQFQTALREISRREAGSNARADGLAIGGMPAARGLCRVPGFDLDDLHSGMPGSVARREYACGKDLGVLWGCRL